MSKHTKLYLTDEQRSQLENMIRSGNAPARTQTKARILLMTDRNSGLVRKDAEIAESVMVNIATVGRTRRAFVANGMDAALYDKVRPGGKPKITGDIEAKLTMLACSTPPRGAIAGPFSCSPTRWSNCITSRAYLALLSASA